MTIKVLVLGATGFIGHKVMEQLHATQGIQPIAASRQATSVRTPPWPTISVNTLDVKQMTQALQGVDAVVNCVAGDANTIREGARILAQACQQQQVPTIVHLSSMAVYGSSIGPILESAPLRRDGGWYGEAKCDAEEILAGLDNQACRVVILRPGCVYGPGSDQWVGRIARLLKSRRIGDLGAAGDGFSNLVHVNDVVQAVAHAVQRPHARGAYNLSCPDAPDWNGYFVALARGLQFTPVKRITRRQLKLDAKVLSIGLKVLEILVSKLKLKSVHIPDPIPPSLSRLWTQDIRLNSDKANTQLIDNWTSLKQGIQSSADWVKQDKR